MSPETPQKADSNTTILYRKLEDMSTMMVNHLWYPNSDDITADKPKCQYEHNFERGEGFNNADSDDAIAVMKMLPPS